MEVLGGPTSLVTRFPAGVTPLVNEGDTLPNDGLAQGGELIAPSAAPLEACLEADGAAPTEPAIHRPAPSAAEGVVAVHRPALSATEGAAAVHRPAPSVAAAAEGAATEAAEEVGDATRRLTKAGRKEEIMKGTLERMRSEGAAAHARPLTQQGDIAMGIEEERHTEQNVATKEMNAEHVGERTLCIKRTFSSGSQPTKRARCKRKKVVEDNNNIDGCTKEASGALTEETTTESRGGQGVGEPAGGKGTEEPAGEQGAEEPTGWLGAKEPSCEEGNGHEGSEEPCADGTIALNEQLASSSRARAQKDEEALPCGYGNNLLPMP